MTGDLVWVLVSAEQPRDNQQVYARVKYGLSHKVTFYTQPAPRWEGGSMVFEFDYFSEWAPRLGDGAAKTGD
jgi:hypothetical protein